MPAARLAGKLGAHGAAADQYGRALRFAGGLPLRERADLLDRHSFECYLTSRLAEAADSRERALTCWRAVGDPLRQGDALRWLSRVAWFSGAFDTAERSAHEAVSLLRCLPPGPELAMAYSNLAQLRMLAGHPAETIHWGQLAVGLAEKLDRAGILAHALNNLGVAEMFTGLPAGTAKLVRSLELARAGGMDEHIARALTNLASTFVRIRELGQASRWLAEGIGYSTERDLDAWRVYMLALRARLHLDQGRWAAAIDDADEVLADPRAASVTRIIALVVTGRVRARRGEPGVWSVLGEALALARDTELPQQLPVVAAWAEAAWLAGEPDRARDLTQQAQASIPPAGDGHLGWVAAELAYWCGRLGQPVAAAPDAPAPFALQIAGDWAAAAARWRALGCPYDAACALAETSQDTDLHAARAELRQLGAKPAAAMVSRRLRAMGVRGLTRGPAAAARGNPGQLTDREQEVLALVAEGLRNTDIAARLFITSRTVDHHVSAILAKLGARTRGEAVRAAARLGHHLDQVQCGPAPALGLEYP